MNLILIALLCLQAPKNEILDLTQMARDENARKVAHAIALEQSKITGNRVPAHQLFENQERDRATYKGKPFEGFIVVLNVDLLARNAAGYYVSGLIEGVLGAQAAFNAEDPDDPILRQLKRGDRVYVRGVVGKRVDQFEACTFALMNNPPRKKKTVPKQEVEKTHVSNEDKAAGRLKVAQMLIKDGKISEGRNRLEMLIRDFPETRAALEARKVVEK